MTPEGKTKAMVTAILRDAQVYWFMPPGVGYGRAGIPDFICCANGHFLAIECKAGRGKTTALQDRELQRIRDAGGTTLVVYDKVEDYRELQRILQIIR